MQELARTVLPNLLSSFEATAETEERIKPSRYPATSHRVRLRSLSGNWTLYPTYGDPQDAPEGHEDADRQADAPMGSSDVHICRMDATNPIQRAPRGFNGLPKAGKELLVDGTVLLYHLSKSLKFREVMWTVTLPTTFADGVPFTADDYRKFLSRWPDFIRWVMEELARDLARLELPNRWLYVIEPQEDRWRCYHVLAPHLHAVIPNRWIPTKRNPHKDKGFGCSGYWALTTEDLDDIITRCAARVMDRPVNCSSAGNVDALHNLGKVGQYLSKFNKIGRYFSKGSRIMGEIQGSQWGKYIPSNWYGCDRETRQQVRASVETFDIGEGSLYQAEIALEAINESYIATTGKPLYVGIHTHWVQSDGNPVPYGQPVPDDAFPVAMTGRVNYLRDIDIGAGLLEALELNRIPIPLEQFDSS